MNDDHIRCVALGHQLLPGHSWCGKPIEGFALVDANHALFCLLKETWMQPCRQCLGAIGLALAGEVRFEELRKPIRKHGFHAPPADIELPDAMPVEEQLVALRAELKALREINETLARQHYDVLCKEEWERIEKYQPDLYAELKDTARK